MNKHVMKNSKLLASGLNICFVMGSFIFVETIVAAPGSLSDRPLSLATSTKPNILLLLDDSGSMDENQVITTEAQSLHGVNTGNNGTSVNRSTVENDLELRALCAGYNALAFNPDIKYTKWQDYLGNTFPDNQAVDMTRVVSNPFPGLGSTSTADLTDDIYIRWKDINSNNIYDYSVTTAATDTNPEVGIGECGGVFSDYDSSAGSIAMLATGDDFTTQAQGILTDSNNNNGNYSVTDNGRFIINVAGGDATSGDTITFTISEFNVDKGSDTDSLTVFAGDISTGSLVNNAITVVSQFNGAGNPKPVNGANYRLPNNSIQPVVSNTLVLADDSASNRNNEIRQFVVNGSSASLVFDGGSNIFTRSGFILSWQHSSGTVPGDGLITKADCINVEAPAGVQSVQNCYRVDQLPVDENSAPADDPYNTQENYANWYTYYRNRISVAKKALGDVVYANEYRVGFATLNDNGYGGAPIRDMENESDGTISVDKSNVLEKIYAARTVRSKPDSNEGTRLIRALSNAGRYFTEGEDPEASFFGTTGTTPHTTIATTHEEDGDNVSSNDTTINKSPIFTDAYGGDCQQNFTLAFTDGAWTDNVSNYLNTDHDVNDNGGGFVGDYDSGLVGTIGSPSRTHGGGVYGDGGLNLDGTGGIVDTLADVAMYYFAEDLAPSVNDSLSLDLHGQTISHQHMITFGVGFGVTGSVSTTPTDYDATISPWPNSVSSEINKIDDLHHASFNGRGAYVSASNAETLATELDSIISEIDVRNGNAGASASFSSFELIDGQFRFDSSYETGRWSGDLRAFAFDASTGDFEENPAWSASSQMERRASRHDSSASTGRKIITYNGSKGIPFQFSFSNDYRNAGEVDALSAIQVEDLLSFAPHPSSIDTSDIARNQAYGEVLVNYLRGDESYDGISLDGTFVQNGTKAISGVAFNSDSDNSDLHSFRDRDDRYLGSFIHSQAIFVGSPNNTYPDDIQSASNPYSDFVNDSNNNNRREMLYIGGNDGMLHGFYANNTDAGEEVFAYVPSMVSDIANGGKGLHRLALETYGGLPYVDGSPKVADVFVDRAYSGSDSAFTVAQWRSYLVGGLRAGGKGVYVLDVTNPDNSTLAAPNLNDAEDVSVAEKIVVNEFTHDQLGHVYGSAQIGRMNNGRWAAIVGNGYNSSDTGEGTASLFVIYLDAPTEPVGSDNDGDGIVNDGNGDYTIITASSASWVVCAQNGGTCILPENAQVRYGARGNYTPVVTRPAGVAFTCDQATMGDPNVSGSETPVCEYSDSNGLSEVEIVDLDNNGTVDRIYGGDLHGNLWVFDVSGSDITNISNGWKVNNTNGEPLFTACGVALVDGVCQYDSRQPITAKPIVRDNPIQTSSSTEPNKLVFLGTGQYLTDDDRGSQIDQSFYTVWDAGSANVGLDKSNLTAQQIRNLGDEGDRRLITSQTVNYSVSDQAFGWYYERLPGDGTTVSSERVVISPILFRNTLVFLTLIPQEGVCIASAGTSYIMAVDPLTGGNPAVDILGTEGSDNIAGIKLGGLAVGLGAIDASGGKDGGPELNVTNADGDNFTPGDGSSPVGVPLGNTAGNLWNNRGRKSWSILQ